MKNRKKMSFSMFLVCAVVLLTGSVSLAAAGTFAASEAQKPAIFGQDIREGKDILEKTEETIQLRYKETVKEAEMLAKYEADEAARIAEEEAARAAAEEAARIAAEQEAAAQAAAEQASWVQEEGYQEEYIETSSEPISASVDDQTLLAALIYCEAGGEPYEGQVAVGAVVVNRVKSGAFPGTVRDVIYQSGQFGPARTGKLDRVLANGSATDSCYQAAAEALAGVSPVGDALYFGDGKNYGQKIGGHWFHS
ncbi:MAG: cell wall hydrolase [Coprococcus sp.]|nr:cell wall hydrolase [Coprococcus sp.]